VTVATLLGLVVTGPTHAATPEEAAAAFDKGLAHMLAGQYELGCPELEQSYALAPLLGVLFTLAECEAAWGKLATALVHYRQFLDGLTGLPPEQRQKHNERRNVAADKIAALGGLVPELTIAVPDGAPAGLVVKRNGVLVEPATYGIARAVDPGDYTVVAEIDGKRSFERALRLSQRDRATVEIPLSLAGPSPSEGSSVSGLEAAGYVAFGVGGLSLAAGLVTGALAWGKKSTIDDNCPDRLCTPEGREAVDAGQSLALASTITFVAGLVGLAAGTTFVLLGSDDSVSEGAQARAAAGSLELRLSGAVDSTGVALAGRF
jgi:hypothetical protein